MGRVFPPHWATPVCGELVVQLFPADRLAGARLNCPGPEFPMGSPLNCRAWENTVENPAKRFPHSVVEGLSLRVLKRQTRELCKEKYLGMLPPQRMLLLWLPSRIWTPWNAASPAAGAAGLAGKGCQRALSCVGSVCVLSLPFPCWQ